MEVTKPTPVSDARLRAIREFYSRHWPDGELVRLLEELEARRKADAGNLHTDTV